jgi:hypothetical protein
MRKCGLLVCMVVLGGGCAGMDGAKPSVWPKTDAKPAEEPRRVTAIWSETAMHQSGRPTVRGFGGRLLFYGADPEKPIKVDGRLVVYAFDESQTQAPKGGGDTPVKLDGTATRKYEFTKDQIPTHHSESAIGPSYSFWIPWDDIGGEQREVTLIPYFVSNSGQVIAGEPTRNVLQGKTPQVAPAEVRTFTRGHAESNAHPVRPVGYETLGAAKADVPGRQMDTATINITPNLARTMGPSAAAVAGPPYHQPAHSPPASYAAHDAHAANAAQANQQPVAQQSAAQQSAVQQTAASGATAFRPPPRARFELDRSPVRDEQAAPPGSGHGSWELYRGGSRPAHPSVRQRPPLPVAPSSG